MEFFERVLLLNALVLGWALTLLAIAFNGIWAARTGDGLFVWGVAGGVVSLALAYFSRALEEAGGLPAVRVSVHWLLVLATVLAWLIWLAGALAHSA